MNFLKNKVMAENQRGPTGQVNQESKSKQNDLNSEMRQGKAKGSPSNVKGNNADMSHKNKEGDPDESRIRGTENSGERRTDSDLNRSRDQQNGSRRNGRSL
jgi:hypothetical protein